MFNLATAPTPPDMQSPARAQELQSQWAKNEKTNVHPDRRNRARELGYQLREPVSGKHRDPDQPPHPGRGPSPNTNQLAHDSHDQALSQQPARDPAKRARSREDRARTDDPAGRAPTGPTSHDGRER